MPRFLLKATAPTPTRTVNATGPERLVFPAVDVLRGFAAVSVVVYHVIEHLKWTTFPIAGPLLWFRIGWMGVDLFLVISGFVITLSLGSLLQRLTYRSALTTFAWRRFARIAPLYYSTCALYVFLVVPALLFTPEFYKNVLAHLLFVHNISDEYSGSINGPNWSVALEVQFYVFYALLAPLLFRSAWWKLALGAVILSWAWRYAMTVYFPVGDTVPAFLRFHATTQLPGTLDEFAAGILLARLVQSSAGERLLRWGRSMPWMPVAASMAAIWALLEVFWRHGTYWDVTEMVVFWRTACATAFAIVVFTACCLDHPTLNRATAPLRYLGTISFGIYLWHLPVLLSVQQVVWLHPEQALWVVLSGTVLIASGSWHLLERPAIQSFHSKDQQMQKR